MSLTFGAVCVDFFWCIHPDHRLFKYKTAPLITIYTFLMQLSITFILLFKITILLGFYKQIQLARIEIRLTK